MKTRMAFIIGVLLLAGCLTAPVYGAQTIPASDKCFRYEGRFDFSDINSPVVIWQASRISIDFEGDTLTLLFDSPKDINAFNQNFFNAQVDNSTTIVDVNKGMPQKGTTFTGLGAGRHRLVISKRSEGNAGSVHFRGIQIGEGAKVWLPAPVSYKLKMEFFGDSVTAGACNEDDGNDQWDNRRTHNAMLSYAAIASEAFSADHRNISVSGMGIITGYVDVKADEMWNRIYPNASSAVADLNAWTPDVVFVKLGDNDEGFTRTHNQPFPAKFTDGYVSLVREIRAAYPKAHIVLLDDMYEETHNKVFGQAWKDIVTQLESGDKNMSHFIFKYHAMHHPRVAEHRKLADELIPWLKQQDFMKSYQ